jgi:hypothetical protein
MKGMFQNKIPNKIHIKEKTSRKSLYFSEHVMMVAYSHV